MKSIPPFSPPFAHRVLCSSTRFPQRPRLTFWWPSGRKLLPRIKMWVHHVSTLCVPCICYPSLLSISDSVSVYPPQIVSCLSQDSLAHTLTNNVNDEGSVAMLPWFHHHTCKILTGFPSDFSPKLWVTKSTSDVTVARDGKLGLRLPCRPPWLS